MGLNSPLDTVRAIASERGVAGLMRGFSSCVVREAIYTAGYLGLAPIAKEYLEKNHEHFAKNQLHASIVGSCVGGTVAAVLTHPVDTAKTCMQSDMAGGTYPNARTALAKVYAEKGVRGLYGGGDGEDGASVRGVLRHQQRQGVRDPVENRARGRESEARDRGVTDRQRRARVSRVVRAGYRFDGWGLGRERRVPVPSDTLFRPTATFAEENPSSRAAARLVVVQM